MSMNSLGEQARYDNQKYIGENYYCQFEVQTMNEKVVDSEQHITYLIRIERTPDYDEKIAIEYAFSNSTQSFVIGDE